MYRQCQPTSFANISGHATAEVPYEGQPTFKVEDLISAILTSEELELLSLVDGTRNLYELCAAGPFSTADNGKLLYAFHVLQLVRRVQVVTASGSLKIQMKSNGEFQKP